MASSDKRLASRKSADHVVEIYQDGLLVGVGHLLDLSSTGALLQTPVRLEKDQSIEIRMRQDSASKLELPATVIRVSQKGAALTYGLRFTRR